MGTNPNPDLAQKLLPSYVQTLYNACYVGRALLAHKAAAAPNSKDAQAHAALDQALRQFDAWIEMAGTDPRTVQMPKPSTPETPEQSPPLTKATV